MKQIVLNCVEDIEKYQKMIQQSANLAEQHLNELSKQFDALGYLEKIKYDQIGFDPLDPKRSLNLIEQVNQTFTYLASLKAAKHLFTTHKDIDSYQLNLGTSKGSDIESMDGSLAAEVFAATHPGSNQKLSKDVKKVKSAAAQCKYVFFSCPGIPEGHYEYKNEKEVVIWSLGMRLEHYLAE